MSEQEKEVAKRLRTSQWMGLDSTGMGGVLTSTAQTIQEILTSSSPTLIIPDETTAVRVYIGVSGVGGYISMLENGTPTALIGLRLSDGNIYDIEQRYNVDNAKFIAGSGTSPFVLFQFYK